LVEVHNTAGLFDKILVKVNEKFGIKFVECLKGKLVFINEPDVHIAFLHLTVKPKSDENASRTEKVVCFFLICFFNKSLSLVTINLGEIAKKSINIW
jgi:hypothetical protein